MFIHVRDSRVERRGRRGGKVVEVRRRRVRENENPPQQELSLHSRTSSSTKQQAAGSTPTSWQERRKRTVPVSSSTCPVPAGSEKERRVMIPFPSAHPNPIQRTCPNCPETREGEGRVEGRDRSPSSCSSAHGGALKSSWQAGVIITCSGSR